MILRDGMFLDYFRYHVALCCKSSASIQESFDFSNTHFNAQDIVEACNA